MVEEEQRRMEGRGVELERRLRSGGEEEVEVDDHLVEEWFALINRKNQVLREVSEGRGEGEGGGGGRWWRGKGVEEEGGGGM